MAQIDNYQKIQSNLKLKKGITTQGKNVTFDTSATSIPTSEQINALEGKGYKVNINAREANPNFGDINTPIAPPTVTTPITPPTSDVTTPPLVTTPETTPQAPTDPLNTNTATPTTTPPPVVPIAPVIPDGFENGSTIDPKTGQPILVKSSEIKRQKNLEKNKSIYGSGQSIYDGIKAGTLIPGTQDFSDLQTASPQAFADYQNIKSTKEKKDTITTLGDTILGKETTPKTSTLDNMIATITSGMDDDIVGEYKNSVINNPEYVAQNEKLKGINGEIVENNNNLRKIGDDTRKLYSGEVPESVIASDIARRSKPLIEQGQYLQDQASVAQAEAARIFDENKGVFDLQQTQRTNNRNLAIQLYGTIRTEEIRAEDIIRADQELQQKMAQAKSEQEFNKYKDERDYNFKVAEALDRQDQANEELNFKKTDSERKYNLDVYNANKLSSNDFLKEEITNEDGSVSTRWTNLRTGVSTGSNPQSSGGQSGGKIQGSGQLVSVNTGNKNVNVDSVAAPGLQAAISQMQSQGIYVLTGLADRDQAQTIKAMGDRVGMPGATAAQLRAAGHKIADVGSSNHEGGMAIDLYSNDKFAAPTQAQIDIMAANGWNHPNIKGDEGHFEYTGKGQQDTAPEAIRYGNGNVRTTEDIVYTKKEVSEQNGKLLNSDSYKALKASESFAREWNNYKGLIEKYGVELLPGKNKSEMQSAYERVMRQAQTFFGLGVLQKLDEDAVQRMIPLATSGMRDSKFLSPFSRSQIKGQIRQVDDMMRSKLQGEHDSLNTIYGSFGNTLSGLQDVNRIYADKVTNNDTELNDVRSLK